MVVMTWSSRGQVGSRFVLVFHPVGPALGWCIAEGAFLTAGKAEQQGDERGRENQFFHVWCRRMESDPAV